MERRKQISFLLPPHLLEPFYDELEKRIKNTGSSSNIKTQLIVEALNKTLGIKDAPKTYSDREGQSLNLKRSIPPEALAERMEKGRNYSISDLSELAGGLSRTTLRRIIIDHPDWFKAEGTGSNGKILYELAKEVTRPKHNKKRKGRKKKTTDKPNVEAVSEPKREPGLLNMEEWDRVTELYDQGKIHHDESQSYTMRYYEENPEIWNDSYEDLEERTMLLNMREKTIKKVLKLLKP